MRQIAFYGKEGVGKSTTSQNTLAALAELGERVLIVGCDPRADSTRLILHARAEDTLLSLAAKAGYIEALRPEEVLRRGFLGIRCVEAGGLAPGAGCVDRAAIAAMKFLEEKGVYDGVDYVSYDARGDTVCSGFVMPARENKAQEIYIVISNDIMAMYAANNIAKGILKHANSGGVRLGGLICNDYQTDKAWGLAEAMARHLGTRLIHFVPRSDAVRYAELCSMTVIERDPEGSQAQEYRVLARKIHAHAGHGVIPTPLSMEELEDILMEFGAMEGGHEQSMGAVATEIAV